MNTAAHRADAPVVCVIPLIHGYAIELKSCRSNTVAMR
jgi:hypothetical protein